jgi:predicted nucleic acid-binding protein
VTILSESIVIDTNVFLLGLRKVHDASESLLANLDRLHLAFPARILRELAANLTRREIQEFYDLFDTTSEVRFDWQPPAADVVQRYRSLGCKRGDAFVAAGIELLGAATFITNNRHFLREITGFPFRILSPEEAMKEIGAL